MDSYPKPRMIYCQFFPGAIYNLLLIIPVATYDLMSGRLATLDATCRLATPDCWLDWYRALRLIYTDLGAHLAVVHRRLTDSPHVGHIAPIPLSSHRNYGNIPPSPQHPSPLNQDLFVHKRNEHHLTKTFLAELFDLDPVSFSRSVGSH